MIDKPTITPSPASGTGPVLLTLGGVAAAFGAAACCGLPLLLTTAGLGTAWLTGLALLTAPNQQWLLLVGTVCLAGGAVLFWRQRRLAACTGAGVCARPAIRHLTLAGLVAGLALLILGYTVA